MKHTKAVRFFEPVAVVKNYSRGFQRVHFSVQSTSSSNILSVNDLNEFTNFVDIREKVKGKYKR